MLSATNGTAGCRTGFLHAGDEPEAEVLADLADLPEEAQVEDQLLVLAGPQVIQQLVHDQQQSVVRVLLLERGHHVFEGALVAGIVRCTRESEGDAERFQVLLELAAG